MALAHVAASCSQPVPPHQPTRHTAAVGTGSWLPPSCPPAAAEAWLRSLPASACWIRSPSRFGDGCPLLPSPTCLQCRGRSGRRWVSAPPAAAPCCHQTSLTFLQRLPALRGGMTAPWDPDLFLLTEAFPCPFFSPLLFQLRLEGSERIRSPKRRLRAQPRDSAWGEQSYSPAKAQLGTMREQKPLTAPPNTPDLRIGLHRAAASQ